MKALLDLCIDCANNIFVKLGLHIDVHVLADK